MNSRLVYYRDCFPFGVIAALLWHSFWFFLVTPEIKMPSCPQRREGAVFLGAILGEPDLMLLSGKGSKKRSDAAPGEDYSRGFYFQKSLSSVYKPPVFLDPVSNLKLPESARAQLPQEALNLSFGVADIGRYLDNIDFSDMKNMFLREELSSVMDFKILVNSKGIVISIVKCIGSGDPVLDFYIMRKFKMAIFKRPYIRTGWIKVLFKIRE